MTEITEEKLDELDALAKDATPGEWTCESSGEERADGRGNMRLICAPSHDHPGRSQCIAAMQGLPFEYANDAAYIAAASPDVVLALVRELRVAQKALEIALHVQYDEPDVDSHAMKDGVKHWAIREARVALEVPA